MRCTHNVSLNLAMKLKSLQRVSIAGLAGGFALLLAMPASALEFRSVKQHGSVLYDAPASSAKKLFVVSRGYPVEVLAEQNGWSRIRDASGGIAWIATPDLLKQRTVVVTSEQAEVRQAPQATAPLLFTVAKDGVLELIEPPKGGWVKVKHRDGVSGYARIQFFWGL